MYASDSQELVDVYNEIASLQEDDEPGAYTIAYFHLYCSFLKPRVMHSERGCLDRRICRESHRYALPIHI